MFLASCLYMLMVNLAWMFADIVVVEVAARFAYAGTCEGV